jgi:hypothetical protein
MGKLQWNEWKKVVCEEANTRTASIITCTITKCEKEKFCKKLKLLL